VYLRLNIEAILTREGRDCRDERPSQLTQRDEEGRTAILMASVPRSARAHEGTESGRPLLAEASTAYTHRTGGSRNTGCRRQNLERLNQYLPHLQRRACDLC
jgi:hypothetical protein